MSPFFIQIYLLLVHPISFHQSPPIPSVRSLSLHFIRSKHRTHFPHFNPGDSALSASSTPGHYFCFRPWKYLILLLTRHFSCRWCLVLLQGLVGMYSAQFPLMMSFHFGCMSCKRKGKGKNTVSKKRTKECKRAEMKSTRREVQRVSSYL